MVHAGHNIPRIECLCILLKRFSYPCRLKDLTVFFKRDYTSISRIVSFMVNFLLDKYNHLLEFNYNLVKPDLLKLYSQKIKVKTGVDINFVGFIDGTVRGCSRPTRYQKRVYNMHKKLHSLKFQSVSLPNGLILQLKGPYEGKMHDSRILRESGLSQLIEINYLLMTLCTLSTGTRRMGFKRTCFALIKVII